VSRPLRVAGLGQHPDIALRDPVPGRDVQLLGQTGDGRPFALQLQERPQHRLVQRHRHLAEAEVRPDLGVAEDRSQLQALQDPARFPQAADLDLELLPNLEAPRGGGRALERQADPPPGQAQAQGAPAASQAAVREVEEDVALAMALPAEDSAQGQELGPGGFRIGYAALDLDFEHVTYPFPGRRR